MKITKYPAPPTESAAERYNRDWLNVPDLDTDGKDDFRHDRTLLRQTVERKSRRYVTNGISAVTDGPYTYDPNSGVIVTPPDTDNPSEPTPTPFFVENFGPTPDSAWTIEGSYNPPGLSPKGTPNETFVGAMRNFTSNNFRIDVELDFPTEIGDPENSHFLPQIMISSASTGAVAGLFVSVGPDTLIRNVLLFDGAGGENHTEFTSNKISFECGPTGMRITAGNKTLSSSIVPNFGNDSELMLVLQSNMGGSIKSVTVYNFDDTPQPEVPVTPEVPEVPETPDAPEGTYQENYTENY